MSSPLESVIFSQLCNDHHIILNLCLSLLAQVFPHYYHSCMPTPCALLSALYWVHKQQNLRFGKVNQDCVNLEYTRTWSLWQMKNNSSTFPGMRMQILSPLEWLWEIILRTFNWNSAILCLFLLRLKKEILLHSLRLKLIAFFEKPPLDSPTPHPTPS